MIDVLTKIVLPIVGVVALILSALLTHRGKRDENRNLADKTKIEKYEVLDAKQEQIAEWGFKAADDANKRADRIAAEAQQQVANLQEQLNELKKKLDEQSAAHRQIRIEHAQELQALRETHQHEIDERNRRIYGLEDELKRQQGDRERQTAEGDRQTREGERQTAEGERQTAEGDHLRDLRKVEDEA